MTDVATGSGNGAPAGGNVSSPGMPAGTQVVETNGAGSNSGGTPAAAPNLEFGRTGDEFATEANEYGRGLAEPPRFCANGEHNPELIQKLADIRKEILAADGRRDVQEKLTEKLRAYSAYAFNGDPLPQWAKEGAVSIKPEAISSAPVSQNGLTDVMATPANEAELKWAADRAKLTGVHAEDVHDAIDIATHLRLGKEQTHGLFDIMRNIEPTVPVNEQGFTTPEGMTQAADAAVAALGDKFAENLSLARQIIDASGMRAWVERMERAGNPVVWNPQMLVFFAGAARARGFQAKPLE